MNVLTSENPVLRRTIRRAAQAGAILLVFYMVLIGGFVLGVREYKWRVITLSIIGLLLGGWFLYKLLFRTNPPNTGLEYPLLVMLGGTVLATIFSTDPRLSAGRASLNIMLAISLYFTLDWISSKWRAELLINALLLAGGVVCIVGLIEYWQWYGGNWVSPVSWREAGVDLSIQRSLRIKSVLHNPNYLAYYLILPIGLACYKLFSAKGWRQRGLWASYLLMTLTVMFLTRSRGGLLGASTTTTVAVALFLWSSSGTNALARLIKRPRQILLVGTLLILIVILLFPVVARTEFSKSTFSRRDDIWQGAVDIFLANPILGAGPATFPTQYMIYRNPLGHTAIFTHGHNVWLTIAAEYGIVGVVGVGFFFIMLARMILSYLRHTVPRQWSMVMVAGISILAGQGIHNLADDFMEFPVFTWFTIFGIALCILPIQAQRPPISSRKRRMWLLLVGAGLLIILGGSLWYRRAFAAYDQARIASQASDWPQVVGWLEETVELDPSYRFYRQQLALAYGEMARADEGYLSLALKQQEQVYHQSHSYSPDAAYLACLYWQAGQVDRAIDLMRTAVSATPVQTGGLYSYHFGQATFYFNLGYYLESVGEVDLAREAYGQVLQMRPQVITSSYWQASDSHRQMLHTLSGATQPYGSGYQKVLELMTNGDFAQAEAIVKKAIALSAPETTPPHYYLWGKFAELQGDTLLAEQNYKQAIGISTAIRTDYANLVGQRQPLATEHPFCLLIPYPAEYLDSPSLALARLVLTDDDPTRAAAIYKNLLRYEPYNLEAQQRLNELSADYSIPENAGSD